MPEGNARTGWFYSDEMPPDDNAYYENMARCVFQAGLSWQMIADKWPEFKKAFKNFDIKTVSDFDEQDIEGLLSNKNIIRNRAKIEATIANAIAFQEVIEEFESFRNYIDNLDKSENYKFVKKDLAKRFERMGPKTSMVFLFSIGEDIKHEG